jgi:hypothetical protein
MDTVRQARASRVKRWGKNGPPKGKGRPGLGSFRQRQVLS